MIPEIFHYILQFGIQAGWLAAALLVLRLILRKAPRFIICALWALVAIRLIFPFDIKSIFSLVPETRDITLPVSNYVSEAIRQVYPQINQTPLITENGMQSNSTIASGDAVNAHLYYIASIIWLIGVSAMLLYSIISCLRLYRITRERIMIEKGVYICDRIPSPFILGVIRPKIFLPSDISNDDKPYVMAHEKAHIKRLDHLWKPLGFLLLSLYWFNPLLWVAYVLLCKDIEMACDEKVIKELGYEAKKSYANALINSAAEKRMITACPLAFGETGVRSRIKNILSYKKPAFWAIAIAIFLSIVIVVCFLTNPVNKSNKGISTSDSPPSFSDKTLLTKMEPYEAVEKFFKANVDKFPMNPTNQDGWTWANVKSTYYGGTYLDGAEQVILLTDTSRINDYAEIGIDIRYEHCEYSYEELNDFIKVFNSHIGAMSNNEDGYSNDITGVYLDEQRNRVIVDFYQLTDDKIEWFKERFGNNDFYLFRENDLQSEDEGIDTMTVSTDLPTITYADEQYVYLDGDCGVVIYDYQNERLIHRILQSFLRKLGFTTPYSDASADGQSIIIFGKEQAGWIVMNVESGEIVASSSSGSPHDFEYFKIGYVGYDIRYGEDGTNLSERRYITTDGTQYTLRVPGWRIKNTELTVKTTDGAEKTYYIFG